MDTLESSVRFLNPGCFINLAVCLPLTCVMLTIPSLCPLASENISEDSNEDYREATLHAVQLFTRLGFVIPPTKSVFHPTQCLEFLVFLLDSTSMTVCLSSKKADKVVALCQKVVRAQEFSIREVASLINTSVSVSPGVEFFGTKICPWRLR